MKVFSFGKTVLLSKEISGFKHEDPKDSNIPAKITIFLQGGGVCEIEDTNREELDKAWLQLREILTSV